MVDRVEKSTMITRCCCSHYCRRGFLPVLLVMMVVPIVTAFRQQQQQNQQSSFRPLQLANHQIPSVNIGSHNYNHNHKRASTTTTTTTGLLMSSGSDGTSTSTSTPTTTSTRAPPRTGLSQTLLNWALESPLWKLLLVPQARATMVRTAEANEIPWTAAKEWIKNQMDEEEQQNESSTIHIPSYYQKAFHAYETGNLSWEAAYEVEIASCAVGARNFPLYGSKGEDAFRNAFESALIEAGAKVPVPTIAKTNPNNNNDNDNDNDNNNVVRIIDFGSGTGMSTRRLAKNFPQADSIIGIDLSPYFIKVGRRLLELTPTSFHEGGPWVSTIQSDDRIQYILGDAAKASKLKQFNSNKEDNDNNSINNIYADAVNIQFVFHELPPDAALDMVDEAFNLLKPNGGQLWICEMDFESPAYAAQRANPLLFSLVRSTEPYLDEYAESISDLFTYIETKFQHVKVVPATGRHFALVATKGPGSGPNINNNNNVDIGIGMEDLRFDDDGNYRVDDTHLPTFQSKTDEK
jgi:SAM-dependent methyltransferase